MRSCLILDKPLSAEVTAYTFSLGQSSENLGHCLKVELQLLLKGLFRKRPGNISCMVAPTPHVIFYHSISISSFYLQEANTNYILGIFYFLLSNLSLFSTSPHFENMQKLAFY